MKKLSLYILEKLNYDVEKWLKSVYETMQKLIKDNKVQQIEIDVKKLNKPKKPFNFNDFLTDTIVKQIISDKQLGFTVTNQMIRNPKQYILDEEKEMNPECYPYWYQQDDNIYFVGLIIYDKTVSYIDNFIHLIGIESSLIVSESQVLNKALLADFIRLANNNGSFNGITVKTSHPKMKATFIKLGFNTLKEDNNILTYKL